MWIDLQVLLVSISTFDFGCHFCFCLNLRFCYRLGLFSIRVCLFFQSSFIYTCFNMHTITRILKKNSSFKTEMAKMGLTNICNKKHKKCYRIFRKIIRAFSEILRISFVLNSSQIFFLIFLFPVYCCLLNSKQKEVHLVKENTCFLI